MRGWKTGAQEPAPPCGSPHTARRKAEPHAQHVGKRKAAAPSRPAAAAPELSGFQTRARTVPEPAAAGKCYSVDSNLRLLRLRASQKRLECTRAPEAEFGQRNFASSSPECTRAPEATTAPRRAAAARRYPAPSRAPIAPPCPPSPAPGPFPPLPLGSHPPQPPGARSRPRRACPLFVVVFMQVHEHSRSSLSGASGGRTLNFRSFLDPCAFMQILAVLLSQHN